MSKIYITHWRGNQNTAKLVVEDTSCGTNRVNVLQGSETSTFGVIFSTSRKHLHLYQAKIICNLLIFFLESLDTNH